MYVIEDEHLEIIAKLEAKLPKKTFQCDQCNRKFGSRYHLYRHTLEHTSGKRQRKWANLQRTLQAKAFTITKRSLSDAVKGNRRADFEKPTPQTHQ